MPINIVNLFILDCKYPGIYNQCYYIHILFGRYSIINTWCLKKEKEIAYF